MLIGNNFVLIKIYLFSSVIVRKLIFVTFLNFCHKKSFFKTLIKSRGRSKKLLPDVFLFFDYVPSNITKNTKLKLVSNNIKMKLDSNNIKIKSNTVTMEQSKKIKVIPGILETLQSNL